MTVMIWNEIHLRGTTHIIYDNFKRLLNTGFLESSMLGLVTISYDVNKNNIESAPVKLYFTDGTAVYLDLTAGYRGTGPNTTCDILSLFNIPNFNKEDILSHQNIVRLRYELTDDEYFVVSGTNI